MPPQPTPGKTTLPDIFLTAFSLLSLLTNPTRRRTLVMNGPTRRHFATPQALSDWLKPRMPSDSFALWGVAPGTKNVHNLWLELNEGETLLADSLPPVRTVNVLTLRVLGTRNRVLVESGQELSDGSFRMRGRPLSEKMRPRESPEVAAYRAVKEELGSVIRCNNGLGDRRQGNDGVDGEFGLTNNGVGGDSVAMMGRGNVGVDYEAGLLKIGNVELGSMMSQVNSGDGGVVGSTSCINVVNEKEPGTKNQGDVGNVDGIMRIMPGSYKKVVEERGSASYPGLPACYVLHCLDAVVEGLPDGDFCTEEEEYGDCDGSSVADQAVSVKRHHWKWVSADSV